MGKLGNCGMTKPHNRDMPAASPSPIVDLLLAKERCWLKLQTSSTSEGELQLSYERQRETTPLKLENLDCTSQHL